MVELGISEFTFGYAFLYEQTRKNWGSLVSAPILPSLKQEAKGGWDAKLPTRGCVYFYQFKLSERMVRAYARFIADGTYNGPYYRIKLHARNNNRQHRVLWEHAQSDPDTYYVSPEFDTIEDFNRAFLSNTITDYSRLIPLIKCHNYSSNDSEQHYITYQENDLGFHQHSKKIRHEGSLSGRELEKIYRESSKRWKFIGTEFAHSIFMETNRKLQTIIDEMQEKKDWRTMEALQSLLSMKVSRDRRTLLSHSAKVMSAVFGVTMVIVGERQEGANHGD